MIKNFFTSVLFLGITILLPAQDFLIEKLGPFSVPSCVLQDSYGFIWIGTEEGLYRYDGYSNKHYSQIPFDSTSLSNNWILTLKEDSKGNLWIGTRGGGLNYFNQKTEKFIRYFDKTSTSNQIGRINIRRIIINNDGSLWLGTITHGLLYVNIDHTGALSYKKYNLSRDPESQNNSGENFIMDLHKDQNGKLWIGTIGGGLKLLDPETGDIRHFNHNPDNPSSLSSNTVSSICEDTSGNLWIGTGAYMWRYGNGLNKLDPRTGRFKRYTHDPSDPSSIGSNNILSLLIDCKGILWIGTIGNYLNTIPTSELLSSRKPHFKHYTNFEGGTINSLYEDRIGNLWISLLGRAVYHYSRQQNPFTWYRPNKANPNSVWSSSIMVQVDKSENIWFGGSGLDRYNVKSRQFRHYTHDPANPLGENSNRVSSICEDNYGHYWIGTDNGLYRLNPKTGIFDHIQENPNDPYGLKTNMISEVLASQAGHLWVASRAIGMQIYDLEERRFYYLDLDTSGRDDERISGIYEDHEGTLWYQTMAHGFYGLHIKDHRIANLRHYMHDPDDRTSLSYNFICDIIRPQIIDTTALWIATGNGLNRLDLKTDIFSHYYKENGLPSNYILKVLEDNQGNIWCSCATGIAVYDIKSGNIRSYSQKDGMPIDKFAGRPQNACKTPDGQLIFGADVGAVGFYPEQLKLNEHIPPIHLIDFKIFHQSVQLDTAIQFKKQLTLAYDKNNFSFEFAALNYTNPNNNHYAYKLDGFHEDWVQCGTTRMVSFTNLDPGEYVFRVKGSNNHGVWNETGTAVIITIRPPWWRTTWAYSMYFIVFCALLFALRQYDLKRQRLKHELTLKQEYTEKLQEIDRIKSRFFANISHEFRTPLTLILGPIETWLTKIRNHQLKIDLKMMKRNANRLYRLINQLLDLSRLESGNISLLEKKENVIQLIRGYVQSFESLAKIRKIILKFSAQHHVLDMDVDRDKLEKIIFNLLSNAFKHTPDGGEISVVISSDNRNQHLTHPKPSVKITISNSGSYIPSDQIEHIFERFYQADTAPMEGEGGSGIGLALTKELVELHQGNISVESDKQLGTSFHVWLPLVIEHSKDQNILESSQIETDSGQFGMDFVNEDYPDLYRKTKIKKDLPLVQVVEDNPDVRFYIRGHLISEFRILESGDGREGLSAAIEKIPDLIVSDVMMPGMDGYELCKKLKSDERTSHIPVILLTARSASEDKIDGFETGADAYLTKPFNAKELIARIKNLISQREQLRTYYLKTLSGKIPEYILSAVEQSFINKVRSIIDKHLEDPKFTIAELAREVGFSHSQLIRKLESLTGLKPSLFIRSHRLLHAKQMLDQKTGNISQVAFNCGFNNLSYFSRSFKAQFGKLPSEYLKQLS